MHECLAMSTTPTNSNDWGQRGHDTGIVAAILTHKVSVLVTQIGVDLARFQEIEVICLEAVLSRTRPLLGLFDGKER